MVVHIEAFIGDRFRLCLQRRFRRRKSIKLRGGLSGRLEAIGRPGRTASNPAFIMNRDRLKSLSFFSRKKCCTRVCVSHSSLSKTAVSSFELGVAKQANVLYAYEQFLVEPAQARCAHSFSAVIRSHVTSFEIGNGIGSGN